MKSSMQSKRMRVSLAVVTAVILAASAQTSLAADKDSCRRLSAVEARQREAEYKFQDEMLDQARDFVKSEKYKEAVEIYDKLVADLAKIKNARNARVADERYHAISREARQVRRAWSKKVLRDARNAMNEEKFSEAIAIVSEIAKINKEDAKIAADLIDRATRMQNNRERAEMMKIDEIDDTYTARQKEIKKNLAQAETFYRAGRYDEARNRVEKVYLLDPYNQRAVIMMEKLYREYLTFGEKRKESSVQGILASAQWVWAEPVFGANRDEKLVVSEKSDGAESKMLAKLERIVFSDVEIHFSPDTDLKQLINEKIGKSSKRFDPDGEGVMIEFRGSLGELKKELHEKDFNMKQIPMSEYLRYFSLLTGIPYRIASDRILFGSEANPLQKRHFQIRSHLIDRIGGGSSAAAAAPVEEEKNPDKGDGGEEKEEAAAPAPAGALTVDQKTLIKFFSDRGIPFGPDCSVSHSARLGRLTVTNTLDNLRRIDELLRQLDAIETPLIMIEIKCIEITENDIQELGFDWSLGGKTVGDTYNVIAGSTKMGETGTSSGTETALGALVQGVTREVATRSNEAVTQISNTSVVKQLNIFPALFGSTHPFGGDVAFNLFLTINALSQNTRTEAMATPKVITSNAETATIKMVKKMYFPEDWDTYEIETNQGGAPYITPPVPTFADDPKEIGTTFVVTPKLDPDGRTINLDLHPRVFQYIADDVYNMSVKGYWRYADGSTEDTIQTFKVTEPVFSERKMDVNVNVYDGETLVLGGMVYNTTTSRNDKIPILGDLPYIGRFFQTEAENTQRKNMILFVTTRLVNNDGVPILRNQKNGLVDFNR